MSKLLKVMMFLCVFLVGCSVKSKEFPYSFIDDIPDNCCYVYDVIENTIDCYDQEKKQLYSYVVNDEDEFHDTFFYSSRDIGRIYSVGDSTQGRFSIIGINENCYDIYYQAEHENMSFFPIAQTDGVCFFSIEIESEDLLKGGLMMWTPTEGIQVIESVSDEEVVLGGAIDGNVLYYTTYCTDDKYLLYQLNYKNAQAEPKLINNALTSPEIYFYDGEVCYYIDDILVVGNVSVKYGAEVYRCQNYLFVFTSDTKGFVACHIYDLVTGEEIKKLPYAIGFSYEKESVFIYTVNGKREEIIINNATN